MGFHSSLFSQEWLSTAHSEVDDRHAVASSYIEKAMRTMLGKYINAVGRFDLETLKLDMVAYITARREVDAAANAMAALALDH